MNDRDGGLAKHVTSCPQEIDWDEAKIVGEEQNCNQWHEYIGKLDQNVHNSKMAGL